MGTCLLTVCVGVGSNLQDHLELYVQQQCTKPITLYKAQKPFHMVKIGLEWLLSFTGRRPAMPSPISQTEKEQVH